MKIKFVGTGGAFDYLYGNSSAVIDFQQRKILLDCGHSVYPRLRALDAVDSLDGVLVTHLHDDHVGSLSTLLFHRYFMPGSKRLTLYYPEEKFRQQVYSFLSISMQQPEIYVDFQPLQTLPGVDFIDTYGRHVANMQTYAYVFSDSTNVMVYSGDLGDPHLVAEQIQLKKLHPSYVFHDICFLPNISAHAYYKDLERYLVNFPLLGYHCDASQNPADNKIPLVYNHPEFLF